MTRRKPFAANNASRKHLEAEGWTCGTVEQTLGRTFIKRDLFGFIDLIAMSPTKGILGVQATGGPSTSNLRDRIRKIHNTAEAGIWLASGGRIQVHHWQGTGQKRELHIREITSLAAVDNGPDIYETQVQEALKQ